MQPDINYSKERKKLLEKQLDQKLDGLQRLMLEHKIVPLFINAPMKKKKRRDPDEEIRYGLTSFLGEGEYGTVFRAVYKGKEVAVKITSEQRELTNWQTIMQIADSMPPELKKHIPKIYELIDDDKSNVGVPSYMVVMEILKPLPDSIKQRLFANEDAKKGGTNREGPMSNSARERLSRAPDAQSVLQLMKDESLMFKAYTAALNKFLPMDGIDLDPHVKQALFKRILDFKPLSAKSELALDFPIFLAGQVAQVVGSLPPDQKDIYSKLPVPLEGIAYQLADEIIRYLKEISIGGSFPWTSTTPPEEREHYKEIPEAASLLKALEYLEAYGISWHDVHSGNVMMRPSTGDLVIVDVGLYFD